MEMPTGFVVKGPYRSGDGSFQFHLVLLKPNAVMGGQPDIVAIADIRVDSDKVCRELAQAIGMVAEQLPPEIVRVN